jgi:prephenate dehydratase
VRAAFLGPSGTFTEEALRASAPAEVEPVPYPTVFETVLAVQTGETDRGIVPIENSIEGSVTATLDAIAVEAPDVRISGEVIRSVHHHLIAGRLLRLSEIDRVISHPQATAQCAAFLRAHLPQAERATAASTAEAVRSVSGADGRWAALGSRLAAELYGCTVLAEGIEDQPGNQTRFVWLVRGGAAVEGPAATKTSIVFWGFNDASPGALVAVLGEIAARGINLTKIESRPRRVALGRYMFFADLDGAEDEPGVRDALDALRGRVEGLRVLGSYPVTEMADPEDEEGLR